MRFIPAHTRIYFLRLTGYTFAYEQLQGQISWKKGQHFKWFVLKPEGIGKSKNVKLSMYSNKSKYLQCSDFVVETDLDNAWCTCKNSTCWYTKAQICKITMEKLYL